MDQIGDSQYQLMLEAFAFADVELFVSYVFECAPIS